MRLARVINSDFKLFFFKFSTCLTESLSLFVHNEFELLSVSGKLSLELTKTTWTAKVFGSNLTGTFFQAGNLAFETIATSKNFLLYADFIVVALLFMLTCTPVICYSTSLDFVYYTFFDFLLKKHFSLNDFGLYFIGLLA